MVDLAAPKVEAEKAQGQDLRYRDLRSADVSGKSQPGPSLRAREESLKAKYGSLYGKEEEWSWEAWARRSEREWLLIARGLEVVVWTAGAALLGAAAAAAPLFYIPSSGYLLAFYQPLGAGVGALLGMAFGLRRWAHAVRTPLVSKDLRPLDRFLKRRLGAETIAKAQKGGLIR